MYDEVPKDQVGNLVARCVQGLFIKALQYELMKYFKLTTISLIANMSPLLTLFLGYLILKENVNRSDIMQVTGSIAAIIMIFLSMQQDR
jgi:drug/metabolite transporter (DMT)-like permease